MNYRPKHDWIQVEETVRISLWLVRGEKEEQIYLSEECVCSGALNTRWFNLLISLISMYYNQGYTEDSKESKGQDTTLKYKDVIY